MDLCRSSSPGFLNNHLFFNTAIFADIYARSTCTKNAPFYGLKIRTIFRLKRGIIVNQSKSRLASIVLIVAAMIASTTPSHAASGATKPGTPVKATAADKLEVGKIGFSDESYCDPDNWSTARSSRSCLSADAPPTYVTSWAFAVTNKSKTKSASQVRAQVTFLDKTGTILLQTIVTVAREIKPGKVSYAASSRKLSDAGITGVTTATVKLVNPTWIVPSTKIYQNPISLNITPGDLDVYKCQIVEPCATEGGLPEQGDHIKIEGDGVFTLRGPAASLPVVVVFLNLQGDPIGGWSGIEFKALGNCCNGPSAVWDFKTGSQQVNFSGTMTRFELANTATYLFVPQI